MKILYYAINGTGLGHLTRLWSIARQVELLASCQNIKCDQRFLTTSEASHAVSEFPVYKLPSKTVLKHCPTTNGKSFIAEAKWMISSLMSHFQPDILVMDTVPEGAFREFLFLKDFAKKTVFIARHCQKDVQLQKSYLKHLALYDLILIPDQEFHHQDYHWLNKTNTKKAFVGEVHQGNFFERGKCLSQEDARHYLGLKENDTSVYVSCGGGGDQQVEKDLGRLLPPLLKRENTKVFVAYGPMYKGKRQYGDGLYSLNELEVSRYFNGIDFAISAAGNNSYQELLYLECPTAFYAQEKGLDQQQRRIDIGLEQRWHLQFNINQTQSYHQAIQNLYNPTSREVFKQQLIKRKKQNEWKLNGSIQSAVELITLFNHKSSTKIEVLTECDFWINWLELKPHLNVNEIFKHHQALTQFMNIALKPEESSEWKYLGSKQDSMILENCWIWSECIFNWQKLWGEQQMIADKSLKFLFNKLELNKDQVRNLIKNCDDVIHAKTFNAIEIERLSKNIHENEPIKWFETFNQFIEEKSKLTQPQV